MVFIYMFALMFYLIVDRIDGSIVTNKDCNSPDCEGLILPFISHVHSEAYPRSLTIWCNITDNPGDKITTWKKDDNFISNNININPNYEISGTEEKSSLTIINSKPEDVGDYSCESSNGSVAIIKVRLRPLLEPFHEHFKSNYKSANIMIGYKFSLVCTVRKEFAADANLTWYRYNETLRTESNKYITINDVNLLPISSNDRVKVEGNNTFKTLTIEELEPSDRAYYLCVADNGVTYFNNTILLRVREKWGIIWPILGIICEFSLLGAILFIYEKRKVKTEDDQEMKAFVKSRGGGDQKSAAKKRK